MKKDVSEFALIQGIERRTEVAAAQLYDRYAVTLFKIIIIHVKDRGIAEDVLENTFLTIWNKISEYQLQDAHFLLWMAGIAKRLALQKVNKSVLYEKQKIASAIPVFIPDLNVIALPEF